MGGSGGYFPKIVNPDDVLDKLRDSQDETEKNKVNTKVAAEINKLLVGCIRDDDAANKHLEEIKKALSSDIEGTVDFMFGGSVAKHTFVDGLSDIDALMVLNNTELKDKPPKEVLGYFLNRLKGRFATSVVDKGNLAVTIKFNDMDIQVLPALKFKTGVKITDADGKRWNFIKPRDFQKALTNANQKSGGKVVPTIKLAKSIISCFSENRRLSGYHTEALASHIFRDYKGDFKPKDMLKHFFQEASKHVLKPMTDITGQSRHLDSYLGKTGSLKRKLAADSLASIGRRMENADLACSISEWKNILRGL